MSAWCWHEYKAWELGCPPTEQPLGTDALYSPGLSWSLYLTDPAVCGQRETNDSFRKGLWKHKAEFKKEGSFHEYQYIIS